STSEVRATPQSLTPIEKTLVEKFVGVMLADFSTIFSEATPPIHCLLERVEFVPRFALLFHEDSEIILTEATFSVGSTQGTVDLVMPHTLLSHLHDELPKLFVERETLPQWQSSLQEEVSFVPLELSAVLREMTLPLQETLKWKIGTYLPLGLTSESLVHFVCENRPLLSGVMGQKDHRVAVCVQKVNEGSLSC
ncbi:MAG: FliM/FliN family flagellar motor switch protein, partial [Holosporales bacterium]|nr:FliM/FliN family flagellar motor switch protein [Holosporales bacterium]